VIATVPATAAERDTPPMSAAVIHAAARGGFGDVECTEDQTAKSDAECCHHAGARSLRAVWRNEIAGTMLNQISEVAATAAFTRPPKL
jgi:hypothetical protein